MSVPLECLLGALEKKLDKEMHWRHLGSEDNLKCVQGHFHLTRPAYNSVLYLITPNNRDGTKNPSWRPERALAVGPLSRTLIDAAFNVIAFFDGAPSSRIEHYRRAGWRDVAKDLEEHKRRFGCVPEHATFIKQYEDFVEGWGREFQKDLGITRKELEDTDWWPIPNQMIKRRDLLDPPLGQQQVDFLASLETWFYRTLSAASHMSWTGM